MKCKREWRERGYDNEGRERSGNESRQREIIREKEERNEEKEEG